MQLISCTHMSHHKVPTLDAKGKCQLSKKQPKVENNANTRVRAS